MYAELGDLGLPFREELRTRIKELQKQARNGKRTVADLDKKIQDFSQILTFAKRYAENKKYGDNYQKSKDKERYEREYDYQVRLYEGAKSWLKNSGIDPATLKVRDIEEHLQKLKADRKALYYLYHLKEKEHTRLKTPWKKVSQNFSTNRTYQSHSDTPIETEAYNIKSMSYQSLLHFIFTLFSYFTYDKNFLFFQV